MWRNEKQGGHSFIGAAQQFLLTCTGSVGQRQKQSNIKLLSENTKSSIKIHSSIHHLPLIWGRVTEPTAGKPRHPSPQQHSPAPPGGFWGVSRPDGMYNPSNRFWVFILTRWTTSADSFLCSSWIWASPFSAFRPTLNWWEQNTLIEDAAVGAERVITAQFLVSEKHVYRL